jgi:hypothetical protein
MFFSAAIITNIPSAPLSLCFVLLFLFTFQRAGFDILIPVLQCRHLRSLSHRRPFLRQHYIHHTYLSHNAVLRRAPPRRLARRSARRHENNVSRPRRGRRPNDTHCSSNPPPPINNLTFHQTNTSRSSSAASSPSKPAWLLSSATPPSPSPPTSATPSPSSSCRRTTPPRSPRSPSRAKRWRAALTRGSCRTRMARPVWRGTSRSSRLRRFVSTPSETVSSSYNAFVESCS